MQNGEDQVLDHVFFIRFAAEVRVIMLRRVNGIVTLVLIAVLSAHEVIGAFFADEPPSGNVRLVIWTAIGIAVVHVALSVGTTWQMLRNDARPPSARKKGHQVKKWVTGAIVGVQAVAHALLTFDTVSWVVVVLLLDVAMAVHVCVSAKSLAKDVGLRLAGDMQSGSWPSQSPARVRETGE